MRLHASARPEAATDWRQRDAIPKRDAATVLGRSLPYVDHQIAAGVLTSRQERRGGPHLVCVRSLLALVRDQQPARPRLVWVNPTLR